MDHPKPQEPCWDPPSWTPEANRLNRECLALHVGVTSGYPDRGKLARERGQRIARLHQDEDLYDEGCQFLDSLFETGCEWLLSRIADLGRWSQLDVRDDPPGQRKDEPSSKEALQSLGQIIDHLQNALAKDGRPEDLNAFIGLLDSTTGTFDIAFTSKEGEPAPILSRNCGPKASVVGWCANTKVPFLTGNIRAPGEIERVRGWFHTVGKWDSRSVLCTPLLTEHVLGDGSLWLTPAGAMCFEHPNEDYFDQHDLVFLMFAARILVATVLRIRRLEGLLQSSRVSARRFRQVTREGWADLFNDVLEGALRDLRGANAGLIMELVDDPGGGTRFQGLAAYGSYYSDEEVGKLLSRDQDRRTGLRMLADKVSTGSVTRECANSGEIQSWDAFGRQDKETRDVFKGVVSTLAVPLRKADRGPVCGVLTVESSAAYFDRERGEVVPLEQKEDALERIDIKDWRSEPFVLSATGAGVGLSPEGRYLQELARTVGLMFSVWHLEPGVRPERAIDVGLGDYYLPRESSWLEPISDGLEDSVATGCLKATTIQGPTGSGKSLLARALWEQDPFRRGQRFVQIDISALPSQLIESELFGHEKGAFTDAAREREGAFQRAQGGVLFIDEIQNLSMEAQVKLLVVLEHREVRKLGGDEPESVDVHLLVGTNAESLEALVEQGKLLRDLMFRINGTVIRIPGLREALTGQALFDEMALEIGTRALKRLKQEPSFRAAVKNWPDESDVEAVENAMGARLKIDHEANTALFDRRHAWPGNFRQLDSVLMTSIVHAARMYGLSKGTDPWTLRVSADCLPEEFVPQMGEESDDPEKVRQVKELVEEKFFDIPRRTGEIVEALADKGIERSNKVVRDALKTLVEDRVLEHNGRDGKGSKYWKP